MNTLIPDMEIQTILLELSREIFAVRNPKTDKPIKLMAESGKHSYLRYRHAGDEYCYTPHPDDGWYYSFMLKGFGKGARSGKPHAWKVTRLQAHRKRKNAKARAIKLWRVAKDVKP